MLTVLPFGAPEVLGDRVGERRALERVGRGGAVDQAVVVETRDLVAGRGGRDLEHALLDRHRARDRDRHRRGPRAGDATGAVADQLARGRDAGLVAGLIVLGLQGHRMVRTDLLDRLVDLVDRKVRRLVTGRSEVGQVAGERDQIADRQIKRGRPSLPSYWLLCSRRLLPQAATPIDDKPATTRAKRTSLILDMNPPLSDNTCGPSGPRPIPIRIMPRERTACGPIERRERGGPLRRCDWAPVPRPAAEPSRHRRRDATL